MTNEYYQKHKENFRKEACEGYQNFSGEETGKRQKIPYKDINTILKNKKKRSVSIIRNRIKSF